MDEAFYNQIDAGGMAFDIAVVWQRRYRRELDFD